MSKLLSVSVVEDEMAGLGAARVMGGGRFFPPPGAGARRVGRGCNWLGLVGDDTLAETSRPRPLGLRFLRMGGAGTAAMMVNRDGQHNTAWWIKKTEAVCTAAARPNVGEGADEVCNVVDVVDDERERVAREDEEGEEETDLGRVRGNFLGTGCYPCLTSAHLQHPAVVAGV